ncbi:MAG: T9SS type A sorting domain-containing protein [Psychroserpens sp.]|uniref:T9SS type A sorting domain-containing protein n=1 Tax=Psychroserpens sp. TaxID=2020870 RepID=UPI003C77FBB8
MKHFYTFTLAVFITLSGFSQGYQFGIVSNGNFNFSIVATPDFDVTNSDISDIGFALMLPAGNTDVINISNFNGRVWSATEVTQAQFTGVGLDSNGRDGFAMNLPPGQTIFSHTAGTPFVLVTFDVSNMPTSGNLEILTNTDPLALGLAGAVDSFFNSNIDGTTTQDYFDGISSGQESFSFETLSTSETLVNEPRFSVYPNPSKDSVYVSTNLQIQELTLFDLLGKEVLKNKNSSSFSVAHLGAGTYILKILALEGTFTKKVIVE